MNEGEPVDAGIELGDLPMELVDRVQAATAHASYRSVHRTADGYLVCALAGDRVVLMELALRENNSIAETTRTFLRSDVAVAAVDDMGAALEVIDAGQRRILPVPPDLARHLTP